MLRASPKSLKNLGLCLSKVLASANGAQELVSGSISRNPCRNASYTSTNNGNSNVHLHTPPWYTIKKEEQVPSPPSSSGDEDTGDGFTFNARHPSQSQQFAVLSQLRSNYPHQVWNTITKLYPKNNDQSKARVAVDIAVGAEGRGGVELAKRGFHVIGIEADAQLLARTFEFAQQNNAHIELMTAKVEKALVHVESADLVTFFHGLHLVDTAAALQEAWRMLKPGGNLIAAFNDRDLSSPFIRELEDILEKHVIAYNRFLKQRSVDIWSEKLTEGHLFRLIEYAVYPNPVKMRSVSSFIDVLDCMSFVRANLKGPGRKTFNNDVRALLERRFDHHSFELPLETKLFVLTKVSEEERRNGHRGRKKYHERHDAGSSHRPPVQKETIFTT